MHDLLVALAYLGMVIAPAVFAARTTKDPHERVPGTGRRGKG